MSRLAFSLMVLTLAVAVTRGQPVLTGEMLRQYEGAFAGVGALSIMFMVVVVACARTPAQSARFRAAREPDPAVRCPVCSSGGGEHWVSCAKCETPHHRECVRYAARCAVFGCSVGNGGEPTVGKG